jgi:hypothetical protein
MRLVPAAAVILIAGLPFAGQARNHDPVAVVQAFLQAVQRGDCDRAWSYFSSASQAYIQGRSGEMVRREPYYADVFAPRRLYCRPTAVHRFHQYRPRTARLVSRTAGAATVGLERHDPAGFRLPGFFPTRRDVVMVEMRLVEEGGRWRVVIP